MKTNTFFCPFFKCSFNFKAHALQSEPNKDRLSNFVKFQLQSLSCKIEQAFEKKKIYPLKIGPRRTLIWQLKGP